MQEIHPDVVQALQAKKALPSSSFSRSYAVLISVRAGRLMGEPLSDTVLMHYTSARKLLNSTAIVFLFLLFSGLAQELVA